MGFILHNYVLCKLYVTVKGLAMHRSERYCSGAAEKWGSAGVLHTIFDQYFKFTPQYPCIDAG